MLAWFSRKILSTFGWTIEGKPPELKKYVAIVAPHTSNWDFFIFVLMKFALRMKVNFIGKHTIFIGPIGWLLRKLGGKPVVRSSNNNVVDDIVSAFDNSEEMIFALSPEGTRSFKNHWKSGFYHIALKANVPIQFCFLNKTNKRIGFGPIYQLTGDQNKDLQVIREYYCDMKGIRPELFSTIRFKNQEKS